MSTEKYSHVVMENKHMIDEVSAGDDGGEEALKIPFSGVNKKINQPLKNEDHGGGGALVCENLRPPGRIGF
jgi:hypothetical protein